MTTAYRPVLITVVVLAFAAWIVALAGISEVTDDCYSSNAFGATYYTRPIPSGAVAEPVNLGMNCVRGLQFQWWGVWFEFIVLFYVVYALVGSNLPAHQASLTGLLATVTAINMINSRIFMDKSTTNFVWLVSIRNAGLNVAAAGYIMFCTFNLILVLLLGSGLVWFGEADFVGSKGASAAAARGPGPNFSQPATFASPLSGGGARAYLPNSGNTGEVTISAQ